MSHTETSSRPIEVFEAMYREEPARYRRRVRGWIALGYGYVLATIIFLIAITVGGGYLFLSGVLPLAWVDSYLKAGVPAVLLALVIARGFFVKIPEPDGHRLTGALKDQVLAFFEQTRKDADGPRIDNVYLDTELNAAVQQTRTYGIVGARRNNLILGTPLLELATAEELRAIIAHEFG
ncbi:MAG: M48 family metallopeptidase, partial [Pseudomonadota bacterium]